MVTTDVLGFEAFSATKCKEILSGRKPRYFGLVGEGRNWNSITFTQFQ